jgi:hypothetical protein
MYEHTPPPISSGQGDLVDFFTKSSDRSDEIEKMRPGYGTQLMPLSYEFLRCLGWKTPL